MNPEAELESLAGILPPPARPVDVPTAEDWRTAEEALGRRLPSDYKALVERYGAGTIDGFLHVLNPSGRHEPARLVPAVDRLSAGFREIRTTIPDEVPYPIHPEAGGLLPWAFSDNGDVFFWSTESADSDSWPIVLAEAGGPGWATHPGPATRLLADLLRRSYRPPFLPSGFPSAAPAFGPYPENLQLARLFRVLPPPERPSPVTGAGGSADTGASASLGTSLPADYWSIIEAYGRGAFGGDLIVLEPAGDGARAIVSEQRRISELVRVLEERRPGEVPFAIHPAQGGLLAWGHTTAGVTLFWRTVGDDPDAWPIVARDAARSEWFTHRGPIAWFLADLADGSIDVGFLPGGVSRLQFQSEP